MQKQHKQQQKQLQDAIGRKYGVSNKTSSQVITALTEIERQRQRTKVSLPGRPGTQQNQPASSAVQMPNDAEVVDVQSIIGRLYGSSTPAQGSGASGASAPAQGSAPVGRPSAAQGGGLLSLIINIIRSLLGMGRQSQGSADIMNIVGDLLGGATNTSQAPDMASILSGLLGGGGSASGSGSQGIDVEDLVAGLLGGQTSGRSR